MRENRPEMMSKFRSWYHAVAEKPPAIGHSVGRVHLRELHWQLANAPAAVKYAGQGLQSGTSASWAAGVAL